MRDERYSIRRRIWLLLTISPDRAQYAKTVLATLSRPHQPRWPPTPRGLRPRAVQRRCWPSCRSRSRRTAPSRPTSSEPQQPSRLSLRGRRAGGQRRREGADTSAGIKAMPSKHLQRPCAPSTSRRLPRRNRGPQSHRHSAQQHPIPWDGSAGRHEVRERAVERAVEVQGKAEKVQ